MNNIFKLRQLWQLIVALFLEIAREPGVLFWGILFPILMSLGLGLAFTKKQDVTRKVAIIVQKGESAASPENTPVFQSFLKNCERNKSSEKNSWIWKYSIKDDKLGNSTFLFYSMDTEEAMKTAKTWDNKSVFIYTKRLC